MHLATPRPFLFVLLLPSPPFSLKLVSVRRNVTIGRRSCGVSSAFTVWVFVQRVAVLYPGRSRLKMRACEQCEVQFGCCTRECEQRFTFLDSELQRVLSTCLCAVCREQPRKVNESGDLCLCASVWGGGGQIGMCAALLAWRSGDRIPMGVRFFSTRPERPWGVLSLLYNGYRVSFPGVRRPGRGFDHPPSSAEVKERVELYLYSPSGPSWPVLGRTLPFTALLPVYTQDITELYLLPPCYQCTHKTSHNIRHVLNNS
jgi:hypothetical protein